METVKNIAAILGVILSMGSVFTLLSKTARKAVGNFFKKYGNSDEIANSVAEIKRLLEDHMEDEKQFKEDVSRANVIAMEFTKTQCRNIVKNIFYKYNDTKILPLYEKKTLMSVEELYINKLHENSFARLLLDEMSHWEIDYSSSYGDEDNK